MANINAVNNSRSFEKNITIDYINEIKLRLIHFSSIPAKRWLFDFLHIHVVASGDYCGKLAPRKDGKWIMILHCAANSIF